MDRNYRSPPVGQHIVCTFIAPRGFTVDHAKVLETAIETLKDFGYGIFDTTVGYFNSERNFDGNTGYTAVITLSESHMSFHTYPEYGTIAFDFYTCRSDDSDSAWEVFTPLEKKLIARFGFQELLGSKMSFPRLVRPHAG